MILSARWNLLIGAGLVLLSFSASGEAQPPTATAPTTTARHGAPEIQQKRRAFIKNVIAVGLIISIEDNSSITRISVGQKFSMLSSEDKEDILNVIWAYYKTEDPKKNVVLVIDQKSGKEIGEYSPASGGLKMKAEAGSRGRQ